MTCRVHIDHLNVLDAFNALNWGPVPAILVACAVPILYSDFQLFSYDDVCLTLPSIMVRPQIEGSVSFPFIIFNKFLANFTNFSKISLTLMRYNEGKLKVSKFVFNIYTERRGRELRRTCSYID